MNLVRHAEVSLSRRLSRGPRQWPAASAQRWGQGHVDQGGRPSPGAFPPAVPSTWNMSPLPRLGLHSIKVSTEKSLPQKAVPADQSHRGRAPPACALTSCVSSLALAVPWPLPTLCLQRARPVRKHPSGAAARAEGPGQRTRVCQLSQGSLMNKPLVSERLFFPSSGRRPGGCSAAPRVIGRPGQLSGNTD